MGGLILNTNTNTTTNTNTNSKNRYRLIGRFDWKEKWPKQYNDDDDNHNQKTIYNIMIKN